MFQSDNAPDLFDQIQNFMASHGMLRQTSYAHSLQQNKVAEPKNGHLIHKLFLRGNVPHGFWD